MALPDRKHDKPLQKGPYCSYHGGFRPTRAIKWVVVHDTEGSASAYPGQPSAQGVAAYGAGSNAQASWHVTVDEKVAIRCLPDTTVAYHAYSPANDIGLGLEICGWAKWSKVQWFKHIKTLRRSAWVTARWCDQYNIPPRILTRAQVRAGVAGITFHSDVTKYLGKGSHTDPGPNFPRGTFLWLVKRRLGWLSK